MFGEGVSQSDVWGEVPNRNTYKRIVLEQQSEMSKLKNEVAVLKSKLSTHSESSRSITMVSNNPTGPTSSKHHLEVQ